MNLLQSSLTLNMCSERQRTITLPLVILHFLRAAFWFVEVCSTSFLWLICVVCVCDTSVNRAVAFDSPLYCTALALQLLCCCPWESFVLVTNSSTFSPFQLSPLDHFQLFHPVIHRTHLFQTPASTHKCLWTACSTTILTAQDSHLGFW